MIALAAFNGRVCLLKNSLHCDRYSIIDETREDTELDPEVEVMTNHKGSNIVRVSLNLT